MHDFLPTCYSLGKAAIGYSMENEFRRKQYFILSDADVNRRLYGRKLSLFSIIIGNSLSQLIMRGDISSGHCVVYII